GEHEPPASRRVEKTALDHDERERDRRRDAAEEQRLERVAADIPRPRNLRRPDEIGRDGRGSFDAGRGPQPRRRNGHRGETTNPWRRCSSTRRTSAGRSGPTSQGPSSNASAPPGPSGTATT